MLDMDQLRKLVPDGRVKENETLSLHTTFKIGGPAKIFVEPVFVEDFVEIIRYIKSVDEPYFILGNGSNILVSDEGYDGVVISTKSTVDIDNNASWEHLLDNKCNVENKIPLNSIQIKSGQDGRTIVTAGCGVLLSKLARTVADNSLKGFEFAGGIPGSLGGAVTMNAGAYGGEIKDVIVSAMVLDVDGKIKKLSAEQLELGYRHSIIQEKDMLVLGAQFEFENGNRDEIFDLMNDFNSRRRDKQPLEYGSAGSTFKRPEGYFAGKLIQDAGLKGYRVGDVMVSEKHAGFVVNVGNGTCEQAVEVIRHVQEVVMQKFGVELEPEVRFLK